MLALQNDNDAGATHCWCNTGGYLLDEHEARAWVEGKGACSMVIVPAATGPISPVKGQRWPSRQRVEEAAAAQGIPVYTDAQLHQVGHQP